MLATKCSTSLACLVQGVDQVLSSWQSEPVLSVNVPILAGNPDIAQCTFFASLSIDGVQDIARASKAVLVKKALDISEISTRETARLKQAAQRDDVSTVLASAQTIAAAVTATANASSNKVAACEIIQAMASSITSASINTLSSAERGTAIEVLKVAAAANSGANQVTPAQNEGLISELLETVLQRGDDPTALLSTTQHAPSVLSVISTLQNHEVQHALTEQLSSAVAATLDVGGTARFVNGNTTVSSEKRPALDFDARTISASQVSLTTPPALSSVLRASETSEVALSVCEYAQNQMGTAGLPNGTRITSSVMNFDVIVDGQLATVSNLTLPLQMNVTVPLSDASQALSCMYYNKALRSWTTEGVKLSKVDRASGTVLCEMTHLSTFAVFATESPSSSPVPPPSSEVSALVVGLAVGGLCVAGIAVFVAVWKLHSKSDRVRKNNSFSNVDPLLSVQDEMRRFRFVGTWCLRSLFWFFIIPLSSLIFFHFFFNFFKVAFSSPFLSILFWGMMSADT